MVLAHFACALGKHRIDETRARHIHGAHVGRCRHCSTPLEESSPHHWTVQRVHDAGLGQRLR